MGSPQEQKSFQEQSTGNLNMLYAFALVIATAFYPPLHYGMGSHALRLLGPCSVIAMLVYGELGHCPLMAPFIGCWLVAATAQLFLKDRGATSNYMGYPVLCKFGFGERFAKALEGLLVAGAGFLIMPSDEPFGRFFVAGGFSMLMVQMIERAVIQKDLRDMGDAAKRQRYIASLYRQNE